MKSHPRRLLLAAAFLAAPVVLLASPAGAHVGASPDEVPAGSYAAVTLTVPHGCEESPTKALTVEIPEGVTSISPQVHPGWTIATTEEKLATPLDDGEGGQITERTATVSFTAEPGNELPPHFRDQFTIGYKAPDAQDTTLYFKTVQTCVEGSTDWISEWDGTGEEPEHPAPAVAVTASAGDEHGGSGTVDEEATTTTAAATGDAESSDDSDSGSSNGLAIAGLVAGLLGLGAGGLALSKSNKG